MREIKFRVWDSRKNEFKGNDFVYIEQDGDLIELNGQEKELLSRDRHKIMQYTGIKDKNGKEIYEGDLLRKIHNPEDEWEQANYVVYEVFFHDNDCADRHIGFQMNRVHFQGSICGTSDFINFLPKLVNKTEVIGNIYENPELLK